MKNRILRLLHTFVNTLFPRYCIVCGKRLGLEEEHTCINCLMQLPRTNFKGKKGNAVERVLWDDQINTEHANSFLFYHQKSKFCNIYFHFKYYNHPQVAVAYGRIMAQDLYDTDFFNGIDCILPIPLSAKRQKKRGYNQSEKLAIGIAEVVHLPIDTTSIVRSVDNPTQTQFSESERWANVKDIFTLAHPEKLHGKHILIVDDVITTGSTVRAFAHAAIKAGEVRISVISLGTSNLNRKYSFPQDILPNDDE